MARQTDERVSLAILEDRYDGLLITPPSDGFTKLGDKLQAVIEGLIEGVARVKWTGNLTGDQTGAITDAVLEVLRATVVAEIDSRGIAR
ncbi:MAG: hypothetical protein H0V73_07470 [Chloroflexi bacterium]|nr:hypothetical protein [Chloroflexota bacterium]